MSNSAEVKSKYCSELERVVTAATREGLFVCIGGEDSSRGSFEFIKDVMELSRECGAQRFRYCDTIGIMTPTQTYQEIKSLTRFKSPPD